MASIASPLKCGKENSCDERIVIDLDPLPSTPKTEENKPLKMQQDGLVTLHNCSLEDDGLSKGSHSPDDKKMLNKLELVTVENKHDSPEDGVAFVKQTSPHVDEQKTRKLKRYQSIEMHEVVLLDDSPKKSRTSSDSEDKDVKTGELIYGVLEEGNGPQMEISTKDQKIVDDNKSHNHIGNMDSKKYQNGVRTDANILLSNETEVTTVGGVELPLKDVGNALQLLEFCAAFGKVIILSVC